MSGISNKRSLNNGVKEAETVGEGFLSGKCPVSRQCGLDHHPATARRKWSKQHNKMAILCYLQAKGVPNIVYRKRMHQYCKDCGLFELGEQHLAC